MRRRFAALVLAAAVSATLVACTAEADPDPRPIHIDEPGDAGQSASDACGIVRASIDSAADAFSGASADDPASVAEALTTASAQLARVSEQVTNDEVAALLPPLQEMFATASDTMSAVASGDVTKIADMGEIAGELQESVVRFQELCS